MKPLLLVDGYNIIGAWPQAVEQAWTIEESRIRLVHALEDYAGYAGVEIVVVFDGHRSDRKQRSKQHAGGVSVVFTKQGETADHYIEATASQNPRYRPLQVATSDRVEQTVVMGRGATRLSARELLAELRDVRARGRVYASEPLVQQNTIEARLTPQQRELFERMRRRKE